MNGPRGPQLECAPVVSDRRRAICPKNPNDVQPTQNGSAQIARAKVIIIAELVTEAIGTEQWDAGISLQFETAPNEPKIQIETTWRIDQCAHNVQIGRNRMLSDFIPELLAESDDVEARRDFGGNVVFHVPAPHVIEEGEPGEFPNRALREMIITAEVNGAREDAFKPVDEPTLVLPITGQTKPFEHFGTGTEAHAAVLLPDGERCDPDWNEPVLPKGKSEIGVSLNLKSEFPVSSRVQKCALRRPSKWKTAQNERTRGED